MIFKDINELKKCAIEMGEIFSIEEHNKILSYIDKIKNIELDDETKQNLCNNEIRKVLIKNKVVPSYKVIDWLKERREEYIDLMAYIESDRQWKLKNNIVIE